VVVVVGIAAGVAAQKVVVVVDIAAEVAAQTAAVVVDIVAGVAAQTAAVVVVGIAAGVAAQMVAARIAVVVAARIAAVVEARMAAAGQSPADSQAQAVGSWGHWKLATKTAAEHSPELQADSLAKALVDCNPRTGSVAAKSHQARTGPAAVIVDAVAADRTQVAAEVAVVGMVVVGMIVVGMIVVGMIVVGMIVVGMIVVDMIVVGMIVVGMIVVGLDRVSTWREDCSCMWENLHGLRVYCCGAAVEACAARGWWPPEPKLWFPEDPCLGLRYDI
jgi:hypothetical protein